MRPVHIVRYRGVGAVTRHFESCVPCTSMFENSCLYLLPLRSCLHRPTSGVRFGNLHYLLNADGHGYPAENCHLEENSKDDTFEGPSPASSSHGDVLCWSDWGDGLHLAPPRAGCQGWVGGGGGGDGSVTAVHVPRLCHTMSGGQRPL